MRRPIGTVFAAAALISVPASAHASPDVLYWQALCSTGATVACATIVVRTVWIGPGSNVAQVMIKNLQGTDPRDNTGGSVFDGFTLGLPNAAFFPPFHGNPGYGSVGNVGITGGLPGNPPGWGVPNGDSGFDGFLFYMEDQVSGPGPGDGIRGCDPGPQRPLYMGQPISTITTCAAQGYDGWGTVWTRPPEEMSQPYAWDISGASFSISGYTKNGVQFGILFPAGAAIVTPEPSSIALLGTGLLAFGALGWVKSRKARSR